MIENIILSLGVPAELLQGQASYSSTTAHLRAFEQAIAAQRFGLEFFLNVLLDPLLEQGREALEDYKALRLPSRN